MNASRQANGNAVLEEKKRFEDPMYEQKQAARGWQQKNKEGKKEGDAAEEDEEDEVREIRCVWCGGEPTVR